tara:strand:- start:1656 stop:1883 length:228 start_codon:yes stop_codon:yes gene_type:complete
MKSSNEETLEVFRLIIGRDEAEFEANGTISEYLIERGALYGNKLGRQKKKVKEFDIVEDQFSGDWVLLYYCERCF